MGDQTIEDWKVRKLERDIGMENLRRSVAQGVEYLNNNLTLIEKIKGVRYSLSSECTESETRIHVLYSDRSWRRRNSGSPVVAQIHLTDHGVIGNYSPDFRQVVQTIGAIETISFSELGINQPVEGNPYLSE